MRNYAHDPLTIYAIGDNYYSCINHWAAHNNVDIITDILINNNEEIEEFDWSATLTADGDNYKTAGVIVNNIVVMTWWK